jgi:hypothetical protein
VLAVSYVTPKAATVRAAHHTARTAVGTSRIAGRHIEIAIGMNLTCLAHCRLIDPRTHKRVLSAFRTNLTDNVGGDFYTGEANQILGLRVPQSHQILGDFRVLWAPANGAPWASLHHPALCQLDHRNAPLYAPARSFGNIAFYTLLPLPARSPLD